jgi:hypothetical protein
MSHVIYAVPSLDSPPPPLILKPLENEEKPPAYDPSISPPLSQFFFGLGAFSGHLWDQQSPTMGALAQIQYENWLRFQITDQNSIGFQYGFDLPCPFSFCSHQPQHLFLGTFMRGTDQLANFVDYTRFKLIYTLSWPRLETNTRWTAHFDLGYGYTGYLASATMNWRW